MALANDMTALLDKIERRLGLIPLSPHLPEGMQKSDWAKIDELTLTISGLNFDVVFENFVKQIGEIVVKDCETLSLQLAINETRQKIVKEIEKLNKKIATQKQPHKKFALMEELGKLKKELSKV